MEDGYQKTWEECTGYFRVDVERGLSPGQVEEHKKKYGPNGEFYQSNNQSINQSINQLIIQPINQLISQSVKSINQ